MIGSRYRMVGLLGRGGMGEVYRADDLKLGQPVALKFLPAHVEGDPDRLERFLSEVRTALRVTHPNVCRVFDIAQFGNRYFLSMEYVDGEDLASLLRRIGRVPEDKAIEIARQLCAGLAAAHDEGVLHRDLKPANIMIDGRGRAKIADFGLAGATAGIAGPEARVGTPQYMSPEQVAGGALSERTDIYALGLVLYELFTGRRAYDVSSLDELRRAQSSAPASPSSHVSGLNPLVEHAILRCLEADPSRRPSSASKLAATLPGGDPLAMAIAAGHTPSPEMVAAAGSDALLRPGVAQPLLAAALILVSAAAFLGQYKILQRLAAPVKPPDVLIERAREIVGSADGAAAGVDPQDSAWGIELDVEYLNHREGTLRIPPADDFGPRGMRFWYRQSPAPLERVAFPIVVAALVAPSDPTMFYSGETRVWLDREGRLLEFTAVPPQQTTDSRTGADADWSALFRAAGLQPDAWAPSPPQWSPQFFADHQAAWVPRDRSSTTALRVEAGSFQGRPVAFQVIFPWTVPLRSTMMQRTASTRTSNLAVVIILLAAMIASAVVAWRNTHLERADVRGASRLAAFVAAIMLVIWLVDEHHVASIWEMYLFALGIARALFMGALLATFYLALEPYVRRTWPSTIVSWSRLIAGSIRDPLVARDVLLGCAAGGVFGLFLALVEFLIPAVTGSLLRISVDLHPYLGVAHVLTQLAWLIVLSIFLALFMLFTLFMMRLLLGREWAAIVSTVVLASVSMGIGQMPSTVRPGIGLLILAPTIASLALYALTLARIGLVATITATFVYYLLLVFPFAWPKTTWYSGVGFVGVAIAAGLAIVAFSVATGVGRPQRVTAKAAP